MSFSTFSIGVSGHQNLGDDATEHFVAQQARELLRGYQQKYDQVIVYSALAKGTDQLIVEIALQEHIPVEVVLPCAEYETIFASEAEKATYQRLLRASRVLHHLPAQVCSDDAFLAAGQWIVDHSDLMLLAWNGRPVRGRGGTGIWHRMHVLSTGMTRLLESIEVHPTLIFSLFFHDGCCKSLVVLQFSCQLSCQLRS
jgi:hypothetical protein